MSKKLTVILLLLLFSAPAVAQLIFYPLKHKMPAEVIPGVQAFLQPSETVAAGHNELILRLESKNIAEIKRLIEKLDQPAHRLLILVNHDGRFNRQTEGYNVNQQIQLGVGAKANNNYQGQVNIYSNTSDKQGKNNQSIQVLEGHTAYLSMGVNEPVTDFQVQRHGAYSHISSSTRYREASKGFYITPRLSNETVILEIAPHYEEPLSKGIPSAHFTRASTVIRGRLNTWIQLAGLSDDTTHSTREILGRTIQTRHKKNTIWVKVVDLDAKNSSLE